MTERLLEKAALDALGMAHKAGKVAIGFTRTEAALAKERVAAVLHAADAAAEGSRKLAAFLRRQDPADAENVPVVNTFGTMQLDLALGRSNVVHAALLGGPESETFLERLWRLERFRTGSLHGQGQHKAGAARR
jgi:ribosomal protein L7Ae-like RNA K-turn-binding protein